MRADINSGALMREWYAEAVPLMSSGSMMLRQRSTMVPQARQQLQRSSAMYEVISTCL